MSKKKVLFYSLYIGSNVGLNYYSMLYHSLSSLSQFRQHDFDFDVVVFYSTPGINLERYNHLNNFNLTKDFPWVKFIPSNYHITDNHIHLNKWYAIEQMQSQDYDQLFFLDCDTVFLKDPSFIFDECSKKNTIYALFEDKTDHIDKILNYERGFSSGQYVYDKQSISNVKNLFEKVKKQYFLLIDKINKVYQEDKPKANWLIGILEQYAGQRALLNEGVNFAAMSPYHVCYGIGTCDLKFTDYGSKIINATTGIVHYTARNAGLFLPKKLLTADLENFRNSVVKNNTLTTNLW